MHQACEHFYRNLAYLLISEVHRKVILCIEITIFIKQKFDMTHLTVNGVDFL